MAYLYLAFFLRMMADSIRNREGSRLTQTGGSSGPPFSATSILHPSGLMVGSTAVLLRVVPTQGARIDKFIHFRVLGHAYEGNGRPARSRTLCRLVAEGKKKKKKIAAFGARSLLANQPVWTSVAGSSSPDHVKNSNSVLRQQISGLTYSSLRFLT